MNRRIAVFLTGIVVLAGGLVGATYAVGAGPFSDAPEPKLVDFEASDPTCSNGNGTGQHFELAPDGEQTRLTLERTMEVPDLAHSVGNASVERVGESNYSLAVETIEPENGTMGATCVGLLEYTAEVTIPEDANATFTVAVIEDGEQVATVQNGPNSAGASSEASAPE